MNKNIISLFLLLLSAASWSQDSTRGLKPVVTNKEDSIGRNLALVVGISSYPNINHLLYADDDAYLFADFLVNDKICEKKNVILLIDSVATKANFFKELRRLLDKSQPYDRIFIYFAGHGDVETDIESGFLLTYNCEPSNYPATDAIDISMLEKFVNAFVNKKAKVVLITDACRSGNLAGGMSGAGTTINSLTKGFQNVIKILSCQPNQLSQEKNYPGGGHGVFTYHLVDGLSGLADRNNDYFISLRELDIYLEEVSNETKQSQIPKVDGNPQILITPFTETLKLALLAKKQNNTDVALVKKRGGMDSAWVNNPYFKTFIEHLRKSRLTEPAGNNALFTLSEARKNKQPEDMIADMKLELAALLEDEAQKWINKYLRGELESRRAEMMANLLKVRKYLETIESMIGEKDLRYTEIHVKKVFFDAYIIYKNADKKKFTEAISQLEKANKLLPNQAWIYNVMGIFYADLKKYKESENAYRMAIQLSPYWTYPWANLSTLFITMEKYDEAESASKKAVDIDSMDVWSWNNLGVVYKKQKKFAEAELIHKKAIQMDPQNPNSWMNLGMVYEDQQKFNAGEAAYKEAIRVDSGFVSAWALLGGIYFSQMKFSEGEVAYKKALELDSSYIDPLILLSLYYQYSKAYDKAEVILKKLIQLESMNPQHWSSMGSVYTGLGKFPEAEKSFQKALELEPLNAETWTKKGGLYREMKKYPEAEAAFKKSLQLDSSKTAAWTDLGFLYYIQLQKPKEAVPYFEKAVMMSPAQEMNWILLNMILNASGEKEKQIEWLLKRQKQFPADISIPKQIGFCYIDLKDFEKAQQYLTPAGSPDATDHYNLACLFASWGKPAEALVHLELAFKNGYKKFDEAEKDKYLAPLRSDPGYLALIKKYKG